MTVSSRACQAYRQGVFVFGSNLAGRHGKGAAAFAREFRGAIDEQGMGPQGRSYAIPTKDATLKPLALAVIETAVRDFFDYARRQPKETFIITRLGCGLAGYRDEQIAPWFLDAPKNCWLPGTWEKRLRPETVARLIVAGGREFDDRTLLNRALMDRVKALGVRPVIVSGRAKGADKLGERWGERHQLAIEGFPAEWNDPKKRKRAGFLRNAEMAWFGTHLEAFHDGQSRGTAGMIRLASDNGLDVHVTRYDQPSPAPELKPDPDDFQFTVTF